MNLFILFLLVGLGSGAVYAALGLGLVVTYKGTGIINFGAGAMAAWSAYVFDELRTTGEFVLPVVGIPHVIHLGGAVGLPVSFTLALGSAILVGLAAHFLVFRPLWRAPILAKVVASVGVLLSMQALVAINFGTTGRAPAAVLPDGLLTVAGQAVPRDRILLAGIVVASAVAVWAYFRYTRLGLATRAAAENERAISLARWSPQLLAASTWVLSNTVVAAVFILAAPSVGLTPTGFSLIIVPALACALVGRLSAIGPVVAAGLVLGALQSELTYAATQTWWPTWAQTGFSDAIPFLLVIVVLFLLGRSLPTRGAAESDPLPAVTIPRVRPRLVAVLIAAGVAIVVLTGGVYRFGVITSMILALIALSLVVLTGMVGQISLAQAAFAGVAGFALSKLATAAGIGFPWSMLLASLIATVLGVIVGLPALRIRGAQLAVVTLSAAIALEQFIFRNPSFTNEDGNLIPNATVLGINLGVRQGDTIARWQFGIFVLVVLVLAGLAVANLMRSATGRRFLAIRSNERAAASVGINVAATKLTAFAIASFIAGLGGTLIGYSRGELSADSFTVLVGVSFLAFAYLGGITSIGGALVAGVLAPLGIGYIVLNQVLADLGDVYALISGVLLIATAIFNPIGIAGAVRANTTALWQRFARPATVAVIPAPRIPSIARPRPTRRPSRPLLEATGIRVTYGGIHAVDNVDLTVGTGRIVGLIGPNGAGKSSLIDALTGFTLYAGTVTLRGEPVDRRTPHQRARQGLARTWQSVELFDDLTVRDNLRVTSQHAGAWSVLRDIVQPGRPVDEGDIDWALDLLDLTTFGDATPSTLSLGQQKLVGVARALAGRPSIVLMDEPAGGLDTDESAALGARLRDIVDHEIAVLLVDHDMGLVLDVCDEIYVLEFGQIIAHGTPAQIRADERVIDAYLGASEVTV